MTNDINQMTNMAGREMVYFHSREHPLSNWHPSYFELWEIRFSSVEQAMMYGKAVLFADQLAADNILDDCDPATLKRLGRSVRDFDEGVWINKREEIVFQATIAKFSQNWHLRTALVETGDAELVEASKTDRIWGAGLDETDPRIRNKSAWPGLNLLGKVLMRARDVVRGQPSRDEMVLAMINSQAYFLDEYKLARRRNEVNRAQKFYELYKSSITLYGETLGDGAMCHEHDQNLWFRYVQRYAETHAGAFPDPRTREEVVELLM